MMGNWIDSENRQIYRYIFKMATVTMATMKNNKVLTSIPSKFNHSDLIGDHNYRIEGEKVRPPKL